MDPKTVRIIYAIVIFVHGIGHSMGVMPLFGLGSETWHSDSWLLTNLLGKQVTRVLGALIWAATTFGFLAVGLGIFGWGIPQSAWRTLAIVFSLVSLAGLFFFWNAFAAFFNKAGAIMVDLVCLIGILLFNWPPVDFGI
jgi:hypothetical protein